jgi:hypothetical protein
LIVDMLRASDRDLGRHRDGVPDASWPANFRMTHLAAQRRRLVASFIAVTVLASMLAVTERPVLTREVIPAGGQPSAPRQQIGKAAGFKTRASAGATAAAGEPAGPRSEPQLPPGEHPVGPELRLPNPSIPQPGAPARLPARLGRSQER